MYPWEGLALEELVDRVVRGTLFLSIPHTWPTPLRLLLEACWQVDPVARPSAEQLVRKLGGMLQ